MWIEKAFDIARIAHAGQVDKGGSPYIEHPMAVAAMVDTEQEKITALLHDVIEDSDMTLDRLMLDGFAPEIIQAVYLLTKKDGEAYESYLEKIKADPIARRVKIADLQHNMDLSRLGRPPTDSDVARLEKYHMAFEYLTV